MVQILREKIANLHSSKFILLEIDGAESLRLLARYNYRTSINPTTMAKQPATKKSATEYIPLTEEQVNQIGGEIMGRDPEGWSPAVFLTRFLSFFGVDPAVVVEVWDLIQVPFIDDGDLSHAQPKHLMWALLFLRKYGDESEMARLAGGFGGAVDEKTFRKWSKIFVHQIASLKYNVVSSFVIGSSCSFHVTDRCFWSLFVADHLGEPKGR